MPYRFNVFTSTLDLVTNPSTGTVIGIAPTTVNAIATWADTTATTIQNSGAVVQPGGAVVAQGFIAENHVTTTVEIGAGESMVLASYLDLDGIGEVIIDGDGELVIV